MNRDKNGRPKSVALLPYAGPAEQAAYAYIVELEAKIAAARIRLPEQPERALAILNAEEDA